jgi:hypothetical protein
VVQAVNMSCDYETLQCKFLQGTVTNTCYVVVYHNNELSHDLSGSDRYTLNLTVGNYTLSIYDNVGQSVRGLQPAREISFNIPRETNNTLAIGLGVGFGVTGLLLLLCLIVLVVCIIKTFKQRGDHSIQTTSRSSEVHHPEDNNASHVSIYLTPLPLPGQGGSIETGHERPLPRQLRHQPTTAVHRESDDAQFSEVIIPEQSHAFNRDETLPVSRPEEDEEAQVIDSLRDTVDNLHSPPVEQ